MSFPQETEPTPYAPDLYGQIQQQIQQQIRTLGWTGDVIRQWIADQFWGKSWPELTEDERLLLLYRLRVLDSLGFLDPASLFPQDSSPTSP